MQGLALACLLASALAVEGRIFNFTASCSSSAVSKATSESIDSFVSIGTEIGVEVCKRSAKASANVNILAETVAEALARATTFVSAGCEGGHGSASASGSAESTAEAHAKALAKGFFSVESCKDCSAEADVFTQSAESAMVHAVSNAYTEVIQSPNAQDAAVGQEVLDVSIERKIIPVMARLIAEVGTEYGHCYAKGDATVSTGSSAASCASDTESYVNGNIRSAEASAKNDASVNLAAKDDKCTDLKTDGKAGTIAYARATAKVIVDAIAKSESECTTAGKAKGATYGKTDIEYVAKAYAKAYSDAFAKAMSDCGCNVSAHDTAEAIANIYVRAAADADSKASSVGDGKSFSDSLSNTTVKGTVTAVAKAYADAKVAGDGTCTATAEAEACVGSVWTDENCAGPGIEGVLGCIKKDDVCIKANGRVSKCKNKQWIVPSWWDGTHRSCDENKS